MSKKNTTLRAYQIFVGDWYQGIVVAHTNAKARAKFALSEGREGYENPWRRVRSCLVRTESAEARTALERESDRGKYWRDKAENVRLQAQADAFNEKYPVGTPVQVLSAEATTWPNGITTTRTPAWLSGPGSLLVSLEGYSGGFGMEYIKPLV